MTTVKGIIDKLRLQDKDDDDLQNESLRLFDVLDAVCPSEDMRKQFIENSAVNEICDILVESIFTLAESFNTPAEIYTLARIYIQSRINTKYAMLSRYLCGSQFEGTTTIGLNSDQDTLWAYEYPPVIETVEDSSQSLLYFLIVTDKTTHPGYAKLRIVNNGMPQSVNNVYLTKMFSESTDHEGRTFAKHLSMKGFLSPDTVRNGPADSAIGPSGVGDTDYVLAYRCRKIPRTADKWIDKCRPYNWPSRVQIQKMSTFGCFFVGKGHPKCKSPSIEWRISFALQERYLMQGLNTTQHKCYIFLKMIKKDLIHSKADQSISSYHCKTCLFYTIENTESSFWTPENLIQATRLCILTLLQWTNAINCPNFFVPDENMFDRLNSETLKMVAVVLKDILSSRVKFISWIRCDFVGDRFFSTISRSVLEVVKQETHALFVSRVYMHAIKHYCVQRSSLLNTISKFIKSPEECLKEMVELLKFLEYTNKVEEYTRKVVRRAVNALLTYVHLQVSQSIAANMMSGSGSENAVTISDFNYHINKGKDCDLISSMLVEATYLLQNDRFEESNIRLQLCESDLRPFVKAICGCHEFKRDPIGESMFNKFLREHLSVEDFGRQCVTCCMTFLPSQACLVHPALRYEMFRSALTQPNSRKGSDFWFDWIVVDSTVHLFFLLYVLYSKTDNPTLKQTALESLLHPRFDTNLGHRDTLYNLLGWIYFHENKIQDALVYLSHSWKVRPNHNAAKWHLVVFCYLHYKSYTT